MKLAILHKKCSISSKVVLIGISLSYIIKVYRHKSQRTPYTLSWISNTIYDKYRDILNEEQSAIVLLGLTVSEVESIRNTKDGGYLVMISHKNKLNRLFLNIIDENINNTF